MASVINTNVASLNAQRNLTSSQSALQTSLQRLSSGLRINSAKDDAAGLAISERMTSQIRGSQQASRNANDGISLAQTAEGGLSEVTNNLQRIRELSIQSANATNSASDRAALQNEVTQLLSEIDRVGQNTSFNGVKLLDGSFIAQNFQVGANSTANDNIQISSISSARTSQLGGVATGVSASVTGGSALVALSVGDLTLNGQQVGASVAGPLPGQSTNSSFSIAQAINAVSTSSGVIATSNAASVTGTAATAFSAITANTFNINGVNVGTVIAGSTAAGQGANLAAAINAVSTQTGVAAKADATSGAVTLTAADGRDIAIGLNGASVDTTTAAADKATFLTQTGFASNNVGTKATVGTAVISVANGTTASAAIAATSGSITGNAPATGAALNIAAGDLNVVTSTGTISVGNIALGGGNTAVQDGNAIALALNTALSAASGGAAVNGVATVNGTTGAVTLTAGSSQAQLSMSATSTTSQAVMSSRTGFTVAQLGTVGEAAVAQVAGSTTAATVAKVAAAAAAASGGTEKVISAGALTITNDSTGTINIGQITLAAANTAKENGDAIAAAMNLALVAAAGGAAVNGSAAADAGGIITFTAGSAGVNTLALGGTAVDSATATSDRATMTSLTGFTSAQLGTKASAIVTSIAGTTATAGVGATPGGTLVGGSNAAASGASNTTIAAGTLVATSGSTSINIGAITLTAGNTAKQNGDAIALAINSALAAAAGGATVNGTATADVNGKLTITAGTASGGLNLHIGGTAADATTAAANKALLLTQTGLTSAQLGTQASAGVSGVAAVATNNHGSIVLNSISQSGIVIGGASVANAGLTAGTTTASVSTSISALSQIDISTGALANAALATIDGALSTVNTSRANLGAIQNRFSSVVANLSSSIENLSAARSRIQDTDFAQETAALTRNQILQQAGTAMLAQANQLPNTVLSLLR